MFHFNIAYFIYLVFALSICANLVSKTHQGNVISTRTTERNEEADDLPSICKTNPCFSREVATRCRKHDCNFPWEDQINNNFDWNNGKK